MSYHYLNDAQREALGLTRDACETEDIDAILPEGYDVGAEAERVIADSVSPRASDKQCAYCGAGSSYYWHSVVALQTVCDDCYGEAMRLAGRWVAVDLKLRQWVRERDLHKSTTEKQALKMLEEAGELARAVLKQDSHAYADAVGDVFVTLFVGTMTTDKSMLQCVEQALAEIIDRRGKTVDGVFVKES